MKRIRKYFVWALLIIVLALVLVLSLQERVLNKTEQALEEYYQYWKMDQDSIEELNLIIDSLESIRFSETE